MENPITKFAPFLVGEFPKPFQELLDKVTSNEPLTEDDLKKELEEVSNSFHVLNKQSGIYHQQIECISSLFPIF